MPSEPQLMKEQNAMFTEARQTLLYVLVIRFLALTVHQLQLCWRNLPTETLPLCYSAIVLERKTKGYAGVLTKFVRKNVNLYYFI